MATIWHACVCYQDCFMRLNLDILVACQKILLLISLFSNNLKHNIYYPIANKVFDSGINCAYSNH